MVSHNVPLMPLFNSIIKMTEEVPQVSVYLLHQPPATLGHVFTSQGHLGHSGQNGTARYIVTDFLENFKISEYLKLHA